MSHIEIYTIKGRKYRYRVTNYRDKDGKMKHKKKYIGPVEPINKTKKNKKTPSGKLKSKVSIEDDLPIR